ncbi:hypothetical protein THRCLA_10256, partial [Thraustotheca clavata]
ITSCTGALERQNYEFVDAIRHNFGEKVAYYFALMHFYNKALLPIAIVGLVMQILRQTIPVVTYMRLLPFWGLLVSVIWSFSFLKSWDHRNAEMQFEWNNKLHVKQIEYPNNAFHGNEVTDSLTGEMVKVYPSWKRIPVHVAVVIFMLFQTAIMLMLVALWVSIYEMIKDKSKESSLIFSKQWFLILLEGIVFGFFVDVVQWNLVVTNMGRLFTTWENCKTEEAYERSLIRKLFVMDFLNYFTWFFSLAFVYVIPGWGNHLTNLFNTVFFNDPSNCCFGPDIEHFNMTMVCKRCNGPGPCSPCSGWFTFDIHHVDLSAMFVTPIIVTQLLNILIGVVMPVLSKWQAERARAAADRAAQERVREGGSMKILGSLDYDTTNSHFSNKDQTRYLEYTATEIEILNQKARNILFESEQTQYDPYNDFHTLSVQFGFTVMFSILWPLMPLACMLINSIKVRADGYRLCRTLKRPYPRKANGIGSWRGIFSAFAYIAILINVLLMCLSTGSLEFFSQDCIQDYEERLAREGKTLADFIFGPNFDCLNATIRLLVIIVLEHCLLVAAYMAMTRIPGVPQKLEKIMEARELSFKKMLESIESSLPLMDQVRKFPSPTRKPHASPVKEKAFTQAKIQTSTSTSNSSKRRSSRATAKPNGKAELVRQWADTP